MTAHLFFQVIALAEVLSCHPLTKDVFRIGTLVGSSDYARRTTPLDITRGLPKNKQADTLRDFRTGEKNLIISTSVAEEGIDVQACGCVTRWDLPSNMASWAQSRGRARRQRSTFILMFPTHDGWSDYESVLQKWQESERQMTRLYNSSRKAPGMMIWDDGEDEDSDEMIYVPSTGSVFAILFLTMASFLRTCLA
jgi:endoribonuclease Dicer